MIYILSYRFDCMALDKVIKYIKTELKEGFSKGEIRKALLNA